MRATVPGADASRLLRSCRLGYVLGRLAPRGPGQRARATRPAVDSLWVHGTNRSIRGFLWTSPNRRLLVSPCLRRGPLRSNPASHRGHSRPRRLNRRRPSHPRVPRRPARLGLRRRNLPAPADRRSRRVPDRLRHLPCRRGRHPARPHRLVRVHRPHPGRRVRHVRPRRRPDRRRREPYPLARARQLRRRLDLRSLEPERAPARLGRAPTSPPSCARSWRGEAAERPRSPKRASHRRGSGGCSWPSSWPESASAGSCGCAPEPTTGPLPPVPTRSRPQPPRVPPPHGRLRTRLGSTPA
jgi:hypothetical protein